MQQRARQAIQERAQRELAALTKSRQEWANKDKETIARLEAEKKKIDDDIAAEEKGKADKRKADADAKLAAEKQSVQRQKQLNEVQKQRQQEQQKVEAEQLAADLKTAELKRVCAWLTLTVRACVFANDLIVFISMWRGLSSCAHSHWLMC
mgnify:CR=1 FL=1